MVSQLSKKAALPLAKILATRRNNFSQWYRSFQRKLLSHWLKFLRHVAITLVIQGPGVQGMQRWKHIYLFTLTSYIQLGRTFVKIGNYGLLSMHFFGKCNHNINIWIDVYIKNFEENPIKCRRISSSFFTNVNDNDPSIGYDAYVYHHFW